MASYRLSPAAEQDLEAIWAYTARTWSPQQAEAYFVELVHALDLLSGSPGIGRKVDHIRQGYRRFHAAHHLIFYVEAGQDGVDVIRILHEKSDVSRHLGEE